MTATVDVVVPCYNYAKFLPRCVDSILRQDNVGVRVLVIDDSSTDQSREVGEGLAAQDSRVTFRRHVSNMGHIATYNEGLLGWANADYSLLLSADDTLAPGALNRATMLMDSHREVGMTYGMALIIDDDGDSKLLGLDDSTEHRIVPGATFIQRCCEAGNPVPTPTAVVRTTVQQKIGGYRSDLPHTGDMEMWMRFALLGPIGVLRAVQGGYRMHQSNMSAKYYANLLSDQRERLRTCTELIQRSGNHSAQSAQWLDAAAQRLGEEAFWMASRAFDRGTTDESATCLEFAQTVWPDLAQSSMWRRFQLKKRFGPALWRWIRPVLHGMRGLPDRAGLTAQEFHLGDLNGWWPSGAESVAASD